MARSEPSDSVVLTVTASATVASRNCVITGVVLAPAAASCTVALYDPPAGGVMTTTGATLRVFVSGAAAGGAVTTPGNDGGIQFLNGCVAVVAGTGAQATVMSAII